MVDWDIAFTRRNWRVFVQDSFDATDWLRLNLGVAYNQYQYSDASTTPRFAAILRPSPNQSLKLLWGRAIRAPNGSELGDYPTQLQGLVDRVKDESAVSTGVVWEGRAAGGWSASLGVYQDRIQDLLSRQWYVTDADEWLSQPVNMGGMKLRVIEGEIARRVPGRYELGLWLTHQRYQLTGVNHEDEPGAATWEPPRWVARAGAGGAMPWPGGWANLTARYVAAQTSLYGSVRNGGGVRADLTVSGKLPALAGWSWQLEVKNLLDKSMSAPQGGEYYIADVPQLGRRVFLGLRYAY